MKRVLNTERWNQNWYTVLPPRLKCLWDYINSKCDVAGVWEPIDWNIVSALVGEPVTPEDLIHLAAFLRKIGPGKYWVTSFCHDQWKRLSRACPAHIHVCRLLEKHGLMNDPLVQTLFVPAPPLSEYRRKYNANKERLQNARRAGD